MKTEIEAKFPGVDPAELRSRLQKIGAVQEYPELLMRRKNYDYPNRKLHNERNGWIRVRDEGNKVTLSYKQLNDRTLHGTKEVNVVVDNFDAVCDFLESVGFQSKSYQETRREKWSYKGVEITIDTWPWVPTFAEVEGPTEEAVKAAAHELGLGWKTARHGSVENIYQMHYDVTDDEIDHWETITFIPVPEWLLEKKK